jgi:thiol-disulfide isomerase/thioredoxin
MLDTFFRGAVLSVLAVSISALPLLAADLRTMKDPAQVATLFPAGAQLRVLNLWAVWCAPCVAEMPDLRAIDELFGPEVAIAGVSLDDMLPDAKREDTVSFLDKQRIAFPNVYYTGDLEELGNLLKINGEIPITIVYDGKGKELWRHAGRLDRDETIKRLRDALRRTK